MSSSVVSDGPSSAASEESKAVLKRLGLRPVINALGAASQLGCATLSQGVRRAMDAAAQHYVPIRELQERASMAIAHATGAEAGTVASGGEACLYLAAAACMTGADRRAMDRLPDTTGLRNEFAVHRAHRTPFDHAIRGAGGTFVEFGYVGSGSGVGAYRWQLEGAIGERTAAVYYVLASVPTPGALPLDTVVEVAHAHGLPVVVDAAVEDLDGFRRLIASGVDLIAASGGKALRGPAATGILAGRRDLIRAASLQQQDVHVHPDFWTPPLDAGCPAGLRAEPPHQGIGRAFKVGREELAGLIVALDEAEGRNVAAVRRRARALADPIAASVSGIPGVTVSVDDRPRYGYPLVVIQLATAAEATRVVRSLANGEPRIWAISIHVGDGQVIVSPTELRESDLPELTRRLRAAILESTVDKPRGRTSRSAARGKATRRKRRQ